MRELAMALLVLLLATAWAVGQETPLRWTPVYEPGCGGAMTALSISPHDSNHILVCGDMLGVGLSTDGGESWQPTFGFRSYEIADVTWHPTDPQTVWAGTMSGPYVSHDGGRTWQERRAGMPEPSGSQYSAPVEKVLIDPQQPERLLAFGGSSRRWQSPGKPAWGVVWESRDDGRSWSRLTTITPQGSSDVADAAGDNIVIAAWATLRPGTIYAGATRAGFLISTDDGRTWTRHNKGLPPAEPQRLAVHPTDPDVLWVAMDNHVPAGAAERVPGSVLKSTDGGQTWADSSQGIRKVVQGADGNLTSRITALAVAASDPNVLYCNDSAWNGATTYRSNDGGASWRSIGTKADVPTAYFAGTCYKGLTVDPKNANIAFGFGTEYIARTRDGGRTWDDATAYRPDPSKPDHWRGRGYSGLCCMNVAFNPFVPGQTILQAMDAGRIWISDDNMQSWSYPAREPTPWLGGNDLTFSRDGTMYATTGQFGSFNGILRSTDSGKTWTTLDGDARGLPKAGSGLGLEGGGVYSLPDDSSKVWAVLGGRLYHSSNGGEKWSILTDDIGLRWIAGDPTTPARFYVSGREGLYVCRDGRTLQNVGGPRPGAPGRMTCDPSGRLYCCQWRDGRAGLWRYDPTAKPAARWQRLLDEPFAYAVTVDPSSPNRLALATNDHPYHDYCSAGGVWLSADSGQTWRQANDGLPMLRGQAIAFDPHGSGRIVFGSEGRGFFQMLWPVELKPQGSPVRSHRSTAEDSAHAEAGVTPE
jgi:photosystem II stability/assembly factor-like uncharacterized protein